MIFRALWPITDETTSFVDLCNTATPEIPALLAQAHATPIQRGRFSLAESAHVPGSGRTTTWVLLYECPALRTPARPYHLDRKRDIAA